MLPGGLHDWPPEHVRSSWLLVSHSGAPGCSPPGPSQNTPYSFASEGSVGFTPPQHDAVESQ